VGCAIAYRQGYGFRPLVLVSGHGIFGGGELTEHYGARVSIDIWNRRKYPVRIERVSFVFYELRFDEWAKGYVKQDGWYLGSPGAVVFHGSITLESAGHQSIEMKDPFKKGSLDNLDDFVRISVNYFYPIANRHVAHVIVHRYVLNELTAGVKEVKY
jgi:hypothetical protein